MTYRLTIWHSDYIDLDSFETFDAARDAYRALDDTTKQLVNIDRLGDGSDGLTLEEREQLQ